MEATREPVDGFSVEHEPGSVVLILSDRYGQITRYLFTPRDAALVGAALMFHGVEAMTLDSGT